MTRDRALHYTLAQINTASLEIGDCSDFVDHGMSWQLWVDVYSFVAGLETTWPSRSRVRE